jgi:uncharacterized repeat protein (TIGR03943 family)
MSGDAGNVLLVLLGGAIVRISAGDTYLRYVKPALHLPLLASGAILVLLGLLSLWRDNPGRRAATATGRDPAPAGAASAGVVPAGAVSAGVVPAGAVSAGAAATGTPDSDPVPAAGPSDHPGADRPHHPHDHSHGSRMAWLLLVPVFAIFLVAPPALGSYAANRSTVSRLPAQSAGYPPLPAGDPLVIRLDEYEARAVWDAGRTLGGRRFSLTGFVTTRPDGGYYVTRLVISCCAADAVAVRIAVTGAAGSYSPDTWIEVVGRFDGIDHSREHEIGPIATISADSVRPVPAPREPYET